jgi:LytS/YehU family sensor histidine kinase
MSEVVTISFRLEKPFWFRWWFITVFSIALITIIVLIIFLITKRIKRQELIKKKIVQLRADALKAQMNPHLIYNALNNINGLINLGHKQQAQNYLNTFSDLLRLVLESTNKNEITLKNELDINKSFVDFHKQAKNRTFDFEIQLDLKEDVNAILVPPVLIQPYIENSILHGFSKTIKNGIIKVIVQSKNNRLIITIYDNGVGIGNSMHKGNGLGTKLTNERIKLLEKKKENQVKIVKLENGTKAIIDIPLKQIKHADN